MIAQPARRLLAPAITFLLLGLAWQWVAGRHGAILPSLLDVAGDLAARPAFYAANVWTTASVALAGLVLGGLAAVLLAICFVQFRFLRDAIFPVALLLNVTPIVAIAPALIVVFGFNATPHVIVAAIAAFFPMLINAMAGLQAIDAEALEVFRALAASRLDIFLRLRLPSSLPHLFAGGRLAIVAAVVGAIVSEFTGTADGIGAAIVLATAWLNLVQMWAAIFCSAALSLALIGLVDLAERLVVRR
ncbi:MAG TPA: ABC transporter permease subunit [Novosphingobium sp.]|nr:ABC transporter permease subunit [Novosphingobium sp.]